MAYALDEAWVASSSGSMPTSAAVRTLSKPPISLSVRLLHFIDKAGGGTVVANSSPSCRKTLPINAWRKKWHKGMDGASQEWTPSVSEKSRVKVDARHTQAAGLMNGIQKRLQKPAA